MSPGFGDEPTGIVQLIVSEDRYSEAEGLLYLESLQDRIAALPGVEAVGHVDNLQLNLLSTQTVRLAIDGIDPPAGREFFNVDNGQMDEGFLEAAGIPLLQGRNLETTDDEGSDRVAIVSEAFARRFFPTGDVVGRVVRVNDRKVLQLEVTPKALEVRASVSKIQIWVDEGTWLPVRQKFFHSQSDTYLDIAYIGFSSNTGLDSDLFKPHWPKGTKKVKR